MIVSIIFFKYVIIGRSFHSRTYNLVLGVEILFNEFVLSIRLINITTSKNDIFYNLFTKQPEFLNKYLKTFYKVLTTITL